MRQLITTPPPEKPRLDNLTRKLEQELQKTRTALAHMYRKAHWGHKLTPEDYEMIAEIFEE